MRGNKSTNNKGVATGSRVRGHYKVKKKDFEEGQPTYGEFDIDAEINEIKKAAMEIVENQMIKTGESYLKMSKELKFNIYHLFEESRCCKIKNFLILAEYCNVPFLNFFPKEENDESLTMWSQERIFHAIYNVIKITKYDAHREGLSNGTLGRYRKKGYDYVKEYINIRILIFLCIANGYSVKGLLKKGDELNGGRNEDIKEK